MEKSYLIDDLSNPNCHVNQIWKKYQNKKYKVYPINQGRQRFGQYHYLFKACSLRIYDVKFQQYMRMKVPTFDYVLSKVEKDLTKG